MPVAVRLLLLGSGLVGVLYAPLPTLRLLALPALLGSTVIRSWRHRIIHLLPFWALLTLPLLLEHRHPTSPELPLLRSLLSLTWISLLTLPGRVSSSATIPPFLPHPLHLGLLIALRQRRRLRDRLVWGIRAYRLSENGRVHIRYGGFLGRLLLRLDARSVQMGYALRLRESNRD